MERGKRREPLTPFSPFHAPASLRDKGVHNGNFRDDFDRHNGHKTFLSSRSIDRSTWTIMLIPGLSPLKNLVCYFANG